MSEKLTKRKILELASKRDLDPSEELISEVEKDAAKYPGAFRQTSDFGRKVVPMRKRLFAVVCAACALVLLGVCVTKIHFSNRAYAEEYSFEEFKLNDQAEVSEKFRKNQNESDAMATKFVECLQDSPYNGKYKTSIAATGEYTVDLVPADGFPDYYAGRYVNIDGKLIIVIKDNYYEKEYRKCEWYKELAKMLGSEDFACRPVKYNFSELVNGMSDVVFGSLGEAIKEAGVETVGVGLNDYKNRIVIEVRTQEDAAKVNAVITGDLYITEVVGEGELVDT